jgi:sn-glycerol 3-phosphate transport system permease protein
MKIKTLLKPYIMIAPAMAGIAMFTVYPIIRLIILSFYNTNMLNPSKTKFAGFDNYIKEFARAAFSKSLINTVIYTFFMIILVLAISLIMAVWLGRKQSAANSFTQVCVFTPHIVSMVSVALIWTWLLEPQLGLVNIILRSQGLPTSKWLQGSESALMSIIMVSTWKSVGYYTLIFIAAIQSISTEIYEAAELDKTGKVKTFFKITLPMISPQIFFALIITTIGSFKVFETIRVMTKGGPNNATTSIVYLIYTEVFEFSRIGYGAVVGVVLLVIVSILILLYFINLSRKVHYQ